MSDINGDALRGLSDAIKGIKDGGDKLTLTTGTVVSATASETWVQVESGQRFPVDSSTVDAAQGDTVNVTIQKGTATITGNSSQKATNANYVDSTVEPVREAAEQAAKAASEATISAGQAKEQAAAATEAATEAKEKSQAAADAATAAATSATEAATSAKNAESSASAAQTSASNAESSASSAATSASAAASDAATAKSQASAATTAANEAKTQTAAAKTAADQATTDAATAGIAASRAQTAAQAAEKAIGIEPDDTKTEDELASQAWFWTDGGGAHIVAGRKDGTPTSATQTDINDKGLSVVSLEDYSTLASFGVDSDGKAVSRLGETTGSYTEITDSGMDIYAVQNESAKTQIDISKLNTSATRYDYKNPLNISSIQTVNAGIFNLSLNLEVPESSLPLSYATAFKLSDLFPLGENNLVDVSLYFGHFPLDYYGEWSVGVVSGIEASESAYSLVNDDDGSINNLLHGETVPSGEELFFRRGISGVDSINNCYLVFSFRQTKSGSGVSSGYVTLYKGVKSAYYFGKLTQNIVGRFGLDENGLTRAKIGSDGYVQIDDMEVDIYRGNTTVENASTYFFQGYYDGVKPVKTEGWTFRLKDSNLIGGYVPDGFSGNAYSVFKVVDLFGLVDTKIRKFSLETLATAWASDSSISYLEFYIIDKPDLYDDSGEMVDYLYYSGQELPLSVTTDEMQWVKIQNLYIAINLATIPDSLPASVDLYMNSSHRLNYYLYTPTGEATLQSHFGRKTELSYREAAGKEPMFSLDPDAGFALQAPASTGASVTGDNNGLYLGASTKGSIDSYAGSITVTTDNAGEKHIFQNSEASIIYENSSGTKIYSLGYGMDSLELWNIQPRWKVNVGKYMTAGQTCSYEDVSLCSRGIVLVWSLFENGAVKDNACSFFFIPKQWILEKEGIGTPFFLPKWGKTGNHGYKYVYIGRRSIAGNENNNATGTWGGIVINNWNFVLHYVYGI